MNNYSSFNFSEINEMLHNGTLTEKRQAIINFCEWCKDICLMAGSSPSAAYLIAAEAAKGLEKDFISWPKTIPPSAF